MAPKKRQRQPPKKKKRASKRRRVEREGKEVDAVQPEVEVEEEEAGEADVEFVDDFSEDEEEDEETEEEKKHLRELDLDLIIRKIEILSQYPINPSDHYAQRSAEIALCPKGSDTLRTIFVSESKTYFPKELREICVAYYVEDMQMMVTRTIDDFQYFANGKVMDRVRELTTARPVANILRELNKRGPLYLWWFLLRRDIPLCVPLGNVVGNRGGICSLINSEKTPVAAALFDTEEDMLHVGLPGDDGRTKRLQWTTLGNGIVYPHLVGPCLNTSTITLEKMEKCAVDLQVRTKKSKAKWLEYLFALHRAFASIRLWIADDCIFAHTENPKMAQVEATLDWNRFYRKYKCGRPFCHKMKMEEGEEAPADAYLSYASP